MRGPHSCRVFDSRSNPAIMSRQWQRGLGWGGTWCPFNNNNIVHWANQRRCVFQRRCFRPSTILPVIDSRFSASSERDYFVAMSQISSCLYFGGLPWVNLNGVRRAIWCEDFRYVRVPHPAKHAGLGLLVVQALATGDVRSVAPFLEALEHSVRALGSECQSRMVN